MKALNGFRATHRNKWLLIQHDILKIQEVCLLEFYADIFDFDKKHTGFGTFEVYFVEIAIIFGTSENTVRNWHNKLVSIGFIEKTNRSHIYKLKIPTRYINPGKWKGEATYYAELEKDQSIETILLNFGINLQTIGKKVQTVVENEAATATKTSSIALGSSKDKSRVPLLTEVRDRQDKRSKKDYENIFHDGNYKELEVSDFQWIDENLENESTNSQTSSATQIPIHKRKIINDNGQKVTEIPHVNYYQLSPIEKYYAALGDKFPDSMSYFKWKDKKQKNGQWKN